MAQPLTPFGDALAGALGGVYASTLLYPMDTVKTRIQAGTVWKEESLPTTTTTNNKKKDGQEDSKGKNTIVVRKNVGLLDGMIAIARGPEGVAGLYKGLGANILNAFSMQFAYFYWYSFIRNFYMARLIKRGASGAGGGTKPPVIGTAMELILGALAGAVAQLFTIPVAVIATRQQLSSRASSSSSPTGNVSSSDGKRYGRTTISGRPAGAGDDEESKEKTAPLKAAASAVTNKLTEDDSFLGVARDILKEDGITGLWRGLKPSLVLTVNPAITYGVFERVKSILVATSPDGKLTPWTSFLVGALSKTLATIVTFPYILSKIRLQAKNTPYKGALDVLKKVALESGVRGWYQGMQAQIIKAVLTQAVLFVARDYFTGVVRKLLSTPQNKIR